MKFVFSWPKGARRLFSLLLISFAWIASAFSASSPSIPLHAEARSYVTLPIPGGGPTAVEAYHKGNKFYVADGVSGALRVYDGDTHALRTTLTIGRNVYEDQLVVNETYGRAYAVSRDGDQGMGAGTGAIYVIDAKNDSLLATLPPRVSWGNGFAVGHDETRDRIYVSDYERVSWINVSTNAVTPLPLPPGVPSYYFRPEEIAVNETTNDIYMVQAGTYGYHRLWILDADTWTWSWIDFPPLGAYYPQHVQVSEAENKVFVKLIGVPGQPKPGIYVLDRDDGSDVFIGNDDYGEMEVNPESGRLYTGIEVGQNMAIIQTATNSLVHMPLDFLGGGATVVGVRRNTDHAFLAATQNVVIVDGASRTYVALPVENESTGGLLVQDVAVNQDTGWVYVVPDNDLPLVVALQDPPVGPVEGTATPTPTCTSTRSPTSTRTPTSSRTLAPTSTATATSTVTATTTATATRMPTHTPTGVPAPSATPTATAEPGLIVRGHVQLGESSGPGVADVAIHLFLASSAPGPVVATTDAAGYYETPFIAMPGDEMITVWAELVGYTFDPAQYHWRHYRGMEVAPRDFVAHAVTPRVRLYLPQVLRGSSGSVPPTATPTKPEPTTTPTGMALRTATATPTPAATEVSTSTATSTATAGSTATASSTPTLTATHTVTAAPTHTPTSTATDTPTMTPTATSTGPSATTLPQPVSGRWTGMTSRQKPMSFDVAVGGGQWSTFRLTTSYSGVACGVSTSGDIETTAPGPGVIAGGLFGQATGTFSFTGKFTSASAANGTYSFQNYPIVFSLPYPPYVCTYNLTQSGTWTASAPGARISDPIH